MATANQIVVRALKRARIIDAGEAGSASADDLTDGLLALNEMMHGWAGQGIRIAHQTLVSADEFVWFVPATSMETSVLSDLNYRGTWNASTNSPALASSVGTRGYLYRVSVAGSTPLNDVTSWTVNSYAVYDGTEWHTSQPSLTYDGAVVALLAMRLIEDYGGEPGPILARDAMSGYTQIAAQFLRADPPRYDDALRYTRPMSYYGW